MSSSDLTADDGYQSLLGEISDVYTTGQTRATQAVNAHITQTYWQIGHDIVEFEQGGKTRADYGTRLLATLSRDLTLRHGKGFSRSNVIYMRLLYLHYQKGQKPSDLLSWSHHVELLRIEDPLERSFYEQQSIREKWSVPELQRQKKTSLFLRLAAGKDKDAILQLATQGQLIAQPADLLRDPYVFEFLKIPEPHTVSETDLETLLCDHLQPFLLELGKGFTFVGRQYRITLNNTHPSASGSSRKTKTPTPSAFFASACAAMGYGPPAFVNEPRKIQTTRRRPRRGLHPRVDGGGYARLGEGRDRAH